LLSAKQSGQTEKRATWFHRPKMLQKTAEHLLLPIFSC